MANVLINDTYLKAIGEAIRSKLGTNNFYNSSQHYLHEGYSITFM